MSPASTGPARRKCARTATGIASRALTARLRIASSSWFGSTRPRETGLELGGDLDRRAKRAPQHLDHAVDKVNHIHGFRPELLTPSKCEQAFRQRSPALRTLNGVIYERRSPRGLSEGQFRRKISRLPSIAISRLLKSCATPPVICPRLSIFCIWWTCARAASRSRVRSSTRCFKIRIGLGKFGRALATRPPIRN